MVKSLCGTFNLRVYKICKNCTGCPIWSPPFKMYLFFKKNLICTHLLNNFSLFLLLLLLQRFFFLLLPQILRREANFFSSSSTSAESELHLTEELLTIPSSSEFNSYCNKIKQQEHNKIFDKEKIKSRLNKLHIPKVLTTPKIYYRRKN